MSMRIRSAPPQQGGLHRAAAVVCGVDLGFVLKTPGHQVGQGLPFQGFGLPPLQLAFDLVFLPQHVHLPGHGVLHGVESPRQLADLIGLLHDHVGGVQLAPADGPGRHDHLLHRVQQMPHRAHEQGAQQHAEQGCHRLHNLQPLVQGRKPGVGALSFGDGGLEQFVGVLLQVSAAQGHFAVIQGGGFLGVAPFQVGLQLVHEPVVVFVGGAHRLGQQILLLAHLPQIAVDTPQPGVCGGGTALQILHQGVGVAVLPTEIFQGGELAADAGGKLADGMEVAGVAAQLVQHHVGLVVVDIHLHHQRSEKGGEKQDDASLQRVR